MINKLTVLNLFLPCLIFISFGFVFNNNTLETTAYTKETSKNTAKTNWLTWEEAIELNKKTPKKIIIDLYTDWCGWCKKMDASTFSDPKVVDFLNENFYAVKMNAEQKESIFFQNKEFKFIQAGRRGVHELAYSLVDGKLSYPTVVYLTENMERVMVSPGYKNTKAILKELSFVKEEAYKNTPWKEYKRN